MKKMKKILFALILFTVLSINASAADVYFNVTKASNGSGNKCPVGTFYLRYVGSNNETGRGINFYDVFTSKTTRNAYGQTFCMSPGKNAYRNNGTHICERTITPQKKGSNQAFDVAATVAYQQMVNEGIIKANPTTESRVVGILTFRWLEYYYGKLDTGGVTSLNYPYVYTSTKDNRKNSSYWNQNNRYVRAAQRISTNAVKYGNKIQNKTATYEDLVNDGTIWTDEWDFILVNSKVEGNIVTLKFDVTPKVGKAPESVKWKKFDITCEYGFTCNVLSKKKVSDNRGRYVVEIDTSNGESSKTKNQKYGLKVTTAYVDQRNPAAYLMLLTPSIGQSYHQKMLLVKDFNNSYIIQTEIPVNYESDQCLCEEKDGKFTGDYIYYETVDDVTTSQIIKKDDPRVIELKCPDKCENANSSCDIDYDNTGKPTYYCQDGEVCNEDKYHKECLHICETPEENDENKYYCKEKEPNKGGEECSESEYLDECYCPTLKETCEEDPDDPACDEYEEKCPNCNASVSVPGTCNDFDTNNNVDGSISDINLEKTDCNSSVNPVKRCVIDSVDQTNASYEATTEINNNKYCKVWCDENYQFVVPTARYSMSGGYFTLSTKITGTRNCYISSATNPDKPIDVEGFESELNSLNRDLAADWNEWNKWNTLFESSAVKSISNEENNVKKAFTWTYVVYDYSKNTTSTETVEANISKTEIEGFKNKFLEEYQKTNQQVIDSVAAFKKCSTWENNMNFDPEISFEYNNYSELLNGESGTGKFSRVGDVNTKIDNIYCLGETDEQYNCVDSSKKFEVNENTLPDNIFKNAVSVTCNNTGCSANTFKLSLAKWIQKTVTKDAYYTPSQNFSTYHQYGTVKTGTICENSNDPTYKDCLWTRLPDTALPVELKTGKGAFPFTLKFSKIGQSNQTGELGRLVGVKDQVSVLTEYDKLPDGKKCTKYNENNGILSQDTGYVCAYVNNCPECDVSCNGDDCIITKDADTCKNCIFDGENTSFKYRTVSLNSLFPNLCEDGNSIDCRKEGYNWSTVKAEYTKSQIEDAGDTIYENAEYSYTLTPAQLSAIRQFNKDAGSYSNTTMPESYEFGNGELNSNNALQCEQVTYNGITYSVKCISTFLNNTTNKYFTSLKPREETTKFTLWLDSSYCITNGNCVLSREDGIGPSWK